MTLSPGSRLGPYEILSPLGRGGMGEVYRARDTRVDRAVALKVLPEEFFESEERRGRFEREARMLASLNHPGIAVLYSFEEIPSSSSSSSSSSRHLLVMELVEGDDLARKISSGPLSLEEIRSCARQIAEALAAAHEKRIVHRDLKPANVKLTSDGRVKLLDFGLAKRADTPDGSEAATATAGLSEEGAVMGTVPYMSPEQVSGRPLDERTDLFSLGIVLYEMATGRRPFTGDSPAELASAILRDTPPAVGRVRADLPDDLAALIGRCLQKDPRDRVPSARDVLAALDAPRPAAPASVSIAVLPFADMSPAKDQEYLCEGMAEEIMNALVGAGIRVAARMSTFRAARQGEDLAAVARVLNVGHVLEGSIRTAGPRMRVTARLTDATAGFQVWSEKYDRDAADVFAVQDEIAAGVVEAVRSRLGMGAPTPPAARPQVRNLEAYQHYLMGRHLRFTKNDHGSALISLERAVALDPSHGPSWVGLADLHVLAAAYGMRPSGEANAAAKAELATAERLQGETGDARQVEGMIAFAERRWAEADRAMARAIEIEPGNVQAHCWSGMLHSIRGRPQEAILALERAREIDPLSPYPYAMTGFCLLSLQRVADAAKFAGQALAFDDDNLLALWVGGAADVSTGQFDRAVSRLERAAARARTNPFTRGTLGWALAAAGRTRDARGVLETLRAEAVPGATGLSEAWLLAALGDTDAAFEVLRRACDEGQLLVPFTGMPGLDPLRSDPRFPAFRDRLALPAAR